MADQGPPSRFAFIMHADVVGSTALVQKDERIAHERIQGAFRRMKKFVDAYGGTVHEVRGDALVAEFDKASAAVSAALAFQQDEVAADAVDDPRPQLRIGIAMGEVIVADRTVTGAGAVLAQRLEQLAAGGGVVIQGAACESIPQRLPFSFESLGEHEVKGFERPVRAFSVRVTEDCTVPLPRNRGLLGRRGAHRGRAAVAAGVVAVLAAAGLLLAGWQYDGTGTMPVGDHPTTEALPDRPSLAVLPLVTAGEGQDYLADGLTDHLVSTLSPIGGLFVIARSSSFAYKGTSVGASQVARELGVRHLLRGTLKRESDTVEIGLTLVDALSGETLLEQSWKQPWSKVLDLQNRLAEGVVGALDVTLSPVESARLRQRDTTDPVAFDFYLRGQALLFRLAAEDNARAREMFLRAIDRDRQFARALASLAMTYVNDVRFGWNGAGDATLVQASEAAAQSVAADGELARAHLAVAVAALLGGDAATASAEAERATALDGGLADARVVAAESLLQGGDAEGAVARMREALRINPYPPPYYEQVLGRSLYLAGETGRARDHLQRAVELDPGDLVSRVLLSAALGELGEIPDARREGRQVLALAPEFNVQSWIADSAFAGTERVDALRESLGRAGLPSGTLELPQRDTGRK